LVVCRLPQGEDLDLLIKSGRIVNGTGDPWFLGDVGVRGDTIVEIGDLSGRAAAMVIDAKGLVVSPGFIDVHTHCDEGLGLPGPNANLNYLIQGTTTVVTGNCGMGTYRIAETSSAWQKLGVGTNAAMQVGNIPVRRAILGADQLRSPSDEELEQMQDLIRQAMQEGAWGISTGLEYEGYDEYVTTWEVVALTRPVAELGGIYNSHIRDEAGQLLEAIQEAITIGERTGVPVNVSHLKSCGKDHWGQMPSAVRLISEARARGVMITADQYPFLQGSPIETITELVDVPEGMEPLSTLRKTVSNRATPIEAREDARRRYVTELQRALGNPEARRRLRKSTYERRPDYPGFVARWGWQDFRIKVAPKNPELVDRMIIDIIEEQNRDGFDVLADLIMREPAALFASSSQSAEDMRHAMVQEWVMISSDGGALPVIADGASPVHDHPRPFASQAIVLRKYVREEGLLTLEEAIRKMTSLPAQVMKIGDRGLLLEGYRADIAVFDAETVRDNAAYDNAHEYATGIEYVIVNGKVSVERGRFTGGLNGRVLLKSGAG
jgi:N-acyl-D-aspartate/D-glutamate deacylase